MTSVAPDYTDPTGLAPIRKPACFVGVDVGLDGAICALYDGNPIPVIHEMPTDTVRGGTKAKPKNKRVLNGSIIRSMFVGIQSDADELYVLIERPQLRPAMRPSGHVCPICRSPHMIVNQGIAALANFLGQAELIRGILIGLGIAHEDIAPSTWKADIFHGASDKTDARAKAAALFPASSQRFARVKDDGVAEATLLAYYNKKRHNAPF